jgi:hypothetical protein
MFAVSCCFSLFFCCCRALFSLLFGGAVNQKARVSADTRGLAAVFFRHYQRYQRTAASSTRLLPSRYPLFSGVGIQGFKGLLLISFGLARGVTPYDA